MLADCSPGSESEVMSMKEGEAEMQGLERCSDSGISGKRKNTISGLSAPCSNLTASKSITYISYNRNMGYRRTGIVIRSSVSRLWRQIANGTYFLIIVKVYGPLRWKSSSSYNTR